MQTLQVITAPCGLLGFNEPLIHLLILLLYTLFFLFA